VKRIGMTPKRAKAPPLPEKTRRCATPAFGDATLNAGIEVASGVLLTAGIRAYLNVLRRAVPASIPLYVTSGVRDDESQARAMLGKLKAGGAAELYKVYAADSVVAKLLAAAPTVDAWSAIIRQATADGVRLSRHLGGGSVDLRTKNLTDAQVKAIQAAVTQTGGKSLYEGAPPHLHVDLPTTYAVASAGEEVAHRARQALPVWVTLSVVGAAVLGILVLRRKRLAAASEERGA
jgi:hypothetical protein